MLDAGEMFARDALQGAGFHPSSDLIKGVRDQTVIAAVYVTEAARWLAAQPDPTDHLLTAVALLRAGLDARAAYARARLEPSPEITSDALMSGFGFGLLLLQFVPLPGGPAERTQALEEKVEVARRHRQAGGAERWATSPPPWHAPGLELARQARGIDPFKETAAIADLIAADLKGIGVPKVRSIEAQLARWERGGALSKRSVGKRST